MIVPESSCTFICRALFCLGFREENEKDRSQEKRAVLVKCREKSVFVDRAGHGMQRSQTGKAGGLAVCRARIELRRCITCCPFL